MEIQDFKITEIIEHSFTNPPKGEGIEYMKLRVQAVDDPNEKGQFVLFGTNPLDKERIDDIKEWGFEGIRISGTIFSYNMRLEEDLDIFDDDPMDDMDLPY